MTERADGSGQDVNAKPGYAGEPAERLARFGQFAAQDQPPQQHRCEQQGEASPGCCSIPTMEANRSEQLSKRMRYPTTTRSAGRSCTV